MVSGGSGASSVPVGGASGGVVCPECSRDFSSLRGLGVQRRQTHAKEFHLEKLNALNKTKARWSLPETIRMAQLEVRLTLEHPASTNINQLIVEKFPNRTLEAIKGKRRAREYKKLVEDEMRKTLSELSSKVHPENVSCPSIPSTSSSSDNSNWSYGPA